MNDILENIQTLRGIAAVLVVVFHASAWSNNPGNAAGVFDTLGGWGRCGVDIFFVISGFIMVFATHKGNTSPLYFLYRRFARVVPIYWIYTTIFFLLIALIPSAFALAKFDIYHAVYSYLFVSQLFFGDFPRISVGWTLEFEMFFYAIFSISLIFPSRWMGLAVVFLVLLAIVSMGGSIMFLEFLLGIVVALLYLELPSRKVFSYFILAVSVVALVGTTQLEVGNNRFLLWGLPAAGIVYAFASLKAMFPKGFLVLGDASYSIYLVQVFTIKIAYKALALLSIEGILPPTINTLIVIAFTLVTGLVAYFVLERRLLVSRQP